MYALASRHYAQRQGKVVQGGSYPLTPHLVTAQIRLQARYEHYLARGFDVRWNEAQDAFVAEFGGKFHASYCITQVE